MIFESRSINSKIAATGSSWIRFSKVTGSVICIQYFFYRISNRIDFTATPASLNLTNDKFASPFVTLPSSPALEPLIYTPLSIIHLYELAQLAWSDSRSCSYTPSRNTCKASRARNRACLRGLALETRAEKRSGALRVLLPYGISYLIANYVTANQLLYGCRY